MIRITNHHQAHKYNKYNKYHKHHVAFANLFFNLVNL